MLMQPSPAEFALAMLVVASANVLTGIPHCHNYSQASCMGLLLLGGGRSLT